MKKENNNTPEKPDIKKMFDSIAQNYDKLNAIISLNRHCAIKKESIKNININDTDKVLDLCTGTGDIAIHIAKSFAKSGHVTGIDFSTKMLKIAKKKAKGLINIEFLEADATCLPFKNETFDVCTISFGLRNIPDFKKAICEMRRVTKKGGKIVNLETGRPKGIIYFFYKIYFFNIVPFFGKLFAANPNAYTYLPDSTKNFPSQDEMVEIFKELGLKNVRKYDFLFGAISQQIGEN